MKTVTTYITDDGVSFNTKEDAERHEERRKREKTDKVFKYLSTHSGKRLTAKHTLQEHGLWRVCGEDPNCDMGGAHSNPYLATYRGTLNNVLKRAVELKGFWTWGAGGIITKINDIEDV